MRQPKKVDRPVVKVWSRRRKLNPVLSEIALELLRRAYGPKTGSTQMAASDGLWIEEISEDRRITSGNRIRSLKPVVWEDNNRVGKPLKVGERWWVAEPGSGMPPVDKRPLLIRPGMGFGTGRHETTRLCLEALEWMPKFSSMLDLGTGSGILAIAAWRLGAKRIEAMDHDIGALRNARENGRLNHSEPAIRWSRGDIRRWNPKGNIKKFQIVTANLLANVLVTHARRMISWLATDGRLVISGFFHSQSREIEKTFQSLGMRTLRSGRRGRWNVLVLMR